MNPDIQAITGRRSIRKYTGQPVTDEHIARCWKRPCPPRPPWPQTRGVFSCCATARPSPRVADVLPHGQMLRDAAVGFVVCGDPAKAHRQELSYLLQDCSAAVENLLLAAHALGLGGVWLGVHPNEERIDGIRARFGVPRTILPIAAISIGHPAERPAARTRYQDSSVHIERW
jgi:nitroreductase